MRLGSGRRSSVAPGLVLPYPALEKAGLRLRRGQTSLTVAGPGAGKTQFWMNLAHRMKIPTLYWSADTDQTDVTIRSLALWSSYSTVEVERRLDSEGDRERMYDWMGSNADHIDWVFDTPITGKVLGERMKAFAVLHGTYPHLVVVDTLGHTIQNPADEYAETKVVQAKFQELARDSNSHVAMLHHAKGEYDTGDKPIPLTGILNNPTKIPETVLTLYRPRPDTLNVCAVKNRGGKADPSAKSPISLSADFAHATVGSYVNFEGNN